MKRTILKNFRRPFPWIEFIPMVIKKDKSFSIIKRFNFTDSTMYFFNDDDQHDVNKLFGFSIGMHHTNSFRFGWRPNKDLTKMEIVGYEYHNKVRIPTIILYEVELNKCYRYEMNYLSGKQQVQYRIVEEDKFNLAHDKVLAEHFSPVELNKNKWGYSLSLYFGGNKRAPHNMDIYQENF